MKKKASEKRLMVRLAARELSNEETKKVAGGHHITWELCPGDNGDPIMEGNLD